MRTPKSPKPSATPVSCAAPPWLYALVATALAIGYAACVAE
ncbi:hypothetical protein [Glycomyces sp. L485]|nr:hypothetical protein [Glycomyces sp. L485]